MTTTSPTTHTRINIKVENIARSLNEVISQLKNLSPYQRVYKGQSDRYGYDPSGFIERISDRIYWSIKGSTPISSWHHPFYCQPGGTYDHRSVQTFLEETYQTLRATRFTTLVSVYRFYIEFRKKIWSLRHDGH